ncbi:hypothetical protein [Streptomyces inhibens]|uniref:hypothetical protein n=1 Tax=Streptomyces inhibens TaxID=2293571 RepID=UPI0015F28D55|nr:hypothetical protein [Streptomyces inhibens]
MPVEPAPPRAPVPAARRARHGRSAPPWVLMYHSVTEIAGAADDTEETTTPAATTGGIR